MDTPVLFGAFCLSWALLVILAVTRYRRSIAWLRIVALAVLTAAIPIAVGLRGANYGGDFTTGFTWGAVCNVALIVGTRFDPLGPWTAAAPDPDRDTDAATGLRYDPPKRKRLWPALSIAGSLMLLLFLTAPEAVA